MQLQDYYNEIQSLKEEVAHQNYLNKHSLLLKSVESNNIKK